MLAFESTTILHHYNMLQWASQFDTNSSLAINGYIKINYCFCVDAIHRLQPKILTRQILPQLQGSSGQETCPALSQPGPTAGGH